jgi:predicted CopG family antitoxin
LELLVASDAYDRLRKMRGKVKFSLDLDELREDRR